MDPLKKKAALSMITEIVNIVVFDDESTEDESSSESEDSSSNDLLHLVEASIVAYNAKEDKSEKRIKLFMEKTIQSWNDEEFRQHFRLTRGTFEKLLQSIGPKLTAENVTGRPATNPQKQLLAVLWLLATPESYRSVGMKFDLPKSGLYRSFIRVIGALNDIAPVVIQWPTAEKRKQISREFIKCSGIPRVIGAIDGTYVPIKAPRVDAETYICRKCFFAITLQAICNDKREFLNCFVGYPSSVSNCRIFRNSNIYKSIIANPSNYFRQDEFILGDKGYPCLKWCITPFIERRGITRAQIQFNRLHAQTRQVIECTFGLLFGRFRRLRYVDMNKTELIPATVIACCVLHNICLKNNDSDINFEQEGRRFIAEQQGDTDSSADLPVISGSSDEGKQVRDELVTLLT